MPALSVIVCTRDRGLRCLGAIRSVLHAGCGDIEVLVIDQSRESIEPALLPRVADARVRYVHTATTGLSRARNLGLTLSRSPIIAFTDDDCAAEPSWCAEILRAFEHDARIGLVFGNVLPGLFDPAAGFVPGYRRETPYLAVTLAQKADVEGMGACMALRRDVAIELGGFDEWLGAGSHYRAGEDVDFTLRMLGDGHWVFETPAISVMHDGFHSWAQAPALVQSYWLGAGAALGKHLRMRPVSGVAVLAKLGYRFIVSRSRVAASLGPAGSGAARLLAFVRGLAAGATRPVDGTYGLFRAWRPAAGHQAGIEVTTLGSAIDMHPDARQSPDRSRRSA